MRHLVRWTGNALITVSLVGLGVLAYVMLLPTAPLPAPPEPLAQLVDEGPFGASDRPAGAPSSAQSATGAVPLAAAATPAVEPISRLRIESVGLEAEVVPSQLIERDGGTTWEVPAFKVGHAEGTAGAGERGTAILLGHVSSLRSGNVFEDLDRVQVGEVVQVFAESRAEPFAYRVVSTQRVPRTDQSVLEPGRVPAISLITCTGVWLPTIWDYTERLVVRAELVGG